ncbi:MAG: outer membrane protein [Methylophilaceae bacterium]|jgi:outer membrane protein
MRPSRKQLACQVLLCLFSIGTIPSIADETLVFDNRLKRDESLQFEQYSDNPAKTLKQAIEESKALKHQANPTLNIDIKKALQPYDHPEDSNFLDLKNSDKAYQFTLTDLRIKALKNNLNIQIAKVNPDIASSKLKIEEAKFDQIFYVYAQYKESDSPKLSSDYVGFKSTNPILDKQTVKLDQLAQQSKGFDVETGIKVPLRTGGTVTLSTPLMNKKNSRRGGQFDSKQYQSALRFSISQPLLRNAGRDVAEASIRIAGYEQQAATLNTRLQSIRIIAMVDKAYWKLYESWGQLDVRRQQYEYAQQNLQMVKTRVAEGLTARVEISRSEIGVADRLEALIIAETSLKLANRQLQFLMNDIADVTSLDSIYLPSTPPNLVKYDINRQKLLKDAQEGRIELLTQELKLAADLTKIDYLENQTLPLFSIDYQYGTLSNTFNNLGDSYQNVLDGGFSDWSVGFKFELPFSNEANKAKLARAVQQRGQRLTTKTLQTLTVKREIYDAVDQVEQNWQRILAARQQVLIAGINYEAELKQFNEGLRTMTEVLETLTRLGEAQIKEIKAIGDYQVALVDTAYATGTLLGYSKLDFIE